MGFLMHSFWLKQNWIELQPPSLTESAYKITRNWSDKRGKQN